MIVEHFISFFQKILPTLSVTELFFNCCHKMILLLFADMKMYCPRANLDYCKFEFDTSKSSSSPLSKLFLEIDKILNVWDTVVGTDPEIHCSRSAVVAMRRRIMYEFRSEFDDDRLKNSALLFVAAVILW